VRGITTLEAIIGICALILGILILSRGGYNAAWYGFVEFGDTERVVAGVLLVLTRAGVLIRSFRSGSS
jgi:hypothetical protein